MQNNMQSGSADKPIRINSNIAYVSYVGVCLAAFVFKRINNQNAKFDIDFIGKQFIATRTRSRHRNKSEDLLKKVVVSDEGK